MTVIMSQCHNKETDSKPNHVAVENGLDYLLGHFREPLWPRTISTRMTKGKQVLVYSQEEALARFKQSNYEDCRVSAYYYWRPSLVSDFAEIKNTIAPDFVMLDLDRCNFKTERAFEMALSIVLKNIKQKLSMTPTVIWSGNGYHIYIPINAVVLENIRQFNGEDQPSREFLRFAECYLSFGKSDPVHNATVSLNNCLPRIPGSINSKSNTQVHIIKEWDRSRPHINLLIGSFCAHLTGLRLKKEMEYLHDNNSRPAGASGGSIDWIEFLLQKPMGDHRKFLVWMVLPQYLMNVKKLSFAESQDIIKRWLDGCSRLKSLDTRVKQKLKEGFEAAGEGFRPMGKEKVKNWKPELYNLII